MKKTLTAILLSLSLLFTANCELVSLGNMDRDNALVWDANAPEDEVVGYNIYVANQNSDDFELVDTVSTPSWPGSDTLNINGWKAVQVTAFNAIGESDPSERFLVQFRAGIPRVPRNIKLQ